jgi:hypothetical protein
LLVILIRMTKFFKLLITFTILMTSFSSLDAVACGEMKDTSEKKSCCKSENKKGKACCETKKAAENQKKDDGCGGNCNHPSCKCLTFLTLTVLPATLDIKYDVLFLYKEILISYLQVSATTAGFYCNWQPPKIS